MAELARKDGHSLGISTKTLKARQECRASVAAAGRGRARASRWPRGPGGWSLQVPVGTRKVANEAHPEADLQSHPVGEEATGSLSLGAAAGVWSCPGDLESLGPQGV